MSSQKGPQRQTQAKRFIDSGKGQQNTRGEEQSWEVITQLGPCVERPRERMGLALKLIRGSEQFGGEFRNRGTSKTQSFKQVSLARSIS